MLHNLSFFYRAPRFLFRKWREQRNTRLWLEGGDGTFLRNRERLLLLKNKHAGEPCVLIGGGPSINKMDLAKLKNTVTIGCNGFHYKIPEIGFSPTYYTVEDPLPAHDNAEKILNNKSIKIIPLDLMHIFESYDDSEVIYTNLRRSKITYLSPQFPLFSKDFAAESYWGGTVMYYNIQLAHYLGCNPIYLIGVDLSYVIPNEIKQRGAVLESVGDDPNHFDPRYFGAGKKWHLPETERMQLSFSKALAYLDGQGVRLINLGVDSKLKDVPKRNFDEIFL